MSDATRLAKLFHENYEKLAQHYGYVTREDTRNFDPTSPNGQLMIAVCEKLLADIDSECDRLRHLVKLSYHEGYRDSGRRGNRGVLNEWEGSQTKAALQEANDE